MADNRNPSSRPVDRTLQAIGAITQAVLDGDELEALLARIADEARGLIGASVGLVATVAGETLTIRALAGPAPDPVRPGATMSAEGSITAAVIRGGETVVIDRRTEMPPEAEGLMAASGTETLVIAPLGGRAPERGVLLVGTRRGDRPFAYADVALIEAFAAQADTALALSDLRAGERALALAGERQRIARDLHDGVVQALYGVGMGLRALGGRTSDPALARGLDGAVERIDEAISVVRGYIAELGAAEAGDPGGRPRPGSPAGSAGRSVPPPRSASPPAALPSDPIAAIARLARDSSVDDEDGDVLARMLEGASTAVDGYGLVGVLTGDGTAARVRARTGPDVPGRRIGDVVPVDQTIIGRAIALGRPLVINDFSQPQEGIPEALRVELGAVVTVPLLIRGRAFGALSVRRDRGAPPFTDEEVALIEAFAVQAAIALELERVRSELRRGAVAGERDRIGRDLHEHVIQALFGVGLSLQGLAAGSRDPDAGAPLQQAIDELDRAIRDLRRYVFDLGPSVVVERRLDEEVASLARTHVAGAGIELDLEIDPEASRQVGDRAPQLVQIAREALSNVARHSAARRCRVRLETTNGEVVLEIADDGRGAAGEGTTVRGSGRGLVNLRARAAEIGAAIEIHGPGPDGTTVRVTLAARQPPAIQEG